MARINSKAEKPIQGRPKSSELKGDLIVLHVQFPTRFLGPLDHAADEMAQSRSGLVRQLIMQYLKENDYLPKVAHSPFSG